VIGNARTARAAAKLIRMGRASARAGDGLPSEHIFSALAVFWSARVLYGGIGHRPSRRGLWLIYLLFGVAVRVLEANAGQGQWPGQHWPQRDLRDAQERGVRASVSSSLHILAEILLRA
jgi:hypothetical protein